MKVALIIFWIFCCAILKGQDTTDVAQLKTMKYLEYANRVNCDSTSGSNLEHRICLNLEFQRIDSIMNLRLVSVLKSIENDSIKTEVIKFHEIWVKNRRFQSKFISNGMNGHMLGIYYLDCMVTTTNRRIEELEYLLRNE